LDRTRTDLNGNYEFNNLRDGLDFGTFRVREVVPGGWIQTTPDPLDIALTRGEIVVANFGVDDVTGAPDAPLGTALFSPVHGASRGAVIGPALTPGASVGSRQLAPFTGLLAVRLEPFVGPAAQADSPRSPVNGAPDAPIAAEPGVNAGPNTASAESPVNGAGILEFPGNLVLRTEADNDLEILW
jgi:hypothetical protein